MDFFSNPLLNQSCATIKKSVPAMFRDSEWKLIESAIDPTVISEVVIRQLPYESVQYQVEPTTVPIFEISDIQCESIISAAYHCWLHTCYQIQATPNCDSVNVSVLIEGTNRFGIACLQLFPEFQRKIVQANKRNVIMHFFTWPSKTGLEKDFTAAVELCRNQLQNYDCVVIEEHKNKRLAIKNRRYHETNGFLLANVLKWSVLGITLPAIRAIKRHPYFTAIMKSLLVVIPVSNGPGVIIGQAIRKQMLSTNVTVIALFQHETVRALLNKQNTRYNWVRMLVSLGSDIIAPVTIHGSTKCCCRSVLLNNGIRISASALQRFDAVLFVSIPDV